MKRIESEVSRACLQSFGQVRRELQDSRRILPVGVRLEDLSSVLEHRPETHSNGSRSFAASEKAYHGGSSAADAIDL